MIFSKLENIEFQMSLLTNPHRLCDVLPCFYLYGMLNFFVTIPNGLVIISKEFNNPYTHLRNLSLDMIRSELSKGHITFLM